MSGIRGTLNEDLTLADFARYAGNFGGGYGDSEVLLARDTRSTGPAIRKAVAGALAARGCRVLDLGVVSTPALFRESRKRRLPAVMVSASHNEPQFNGLKFIVGGSGIGQEKFESVIGQAGAPWGRAPGSVRSLPRSSYVGDLVDRFGTGSLEGATVALDLGGGAAVAHAVELFRRLGCRVLSINDSPGVFNRRVDPMADDLSLLCRLVKERGCDIGLGFDCDGDRLAVVDNTGRKRTGDFMLTLALSALVGESKERKVAVSVDTTQAVDDVVVRAGGEVFRSKVGEANVVGLMARTGSRFGGEGSSGGLIDGGFNYCRDSLLAALVIMRVIRGKGTKAYSSVPEYHQERIALEIPKARAQKAIAKLANQSGEHDLTDGVKVFVSKRSWVLVRRSGTEDRVRVSAEAETAEGAAKIAKSFASKLRELSR